MISAHDLALLLTGGASAWLLQLFGVINDRQTSNRSMLFDAQLSAILAFDDIVGEMMAEFNFGDSPRESASGTWGFEQSYQALSRITMLCKGEIADSADEYHEMLAFWFLPEMAEAVGGVTREDDLKSEILRAAKAWRQASHSFVPTLPIERWKKVKWTMGLWRMRLTDWPEDTKRRLLKRWNSR